jgi:hypothetical protein
MDSVLTARFKTAFVIKDSSAKIHRPHQAADEQSSSGWPRQAPMNTCSEAWNYRP